MIREFDERTAVLLILEILDIVLLFGDTDLDADTSSDYCNTETKSLDENANEVREVACKLPKTDIQPATASQKPVIVMEKS